VAQRISQNANDKQEVEPVLHALQETTDRLLENLSAGNGYWSGDNLQALEQAASILT
jgi:transposase